MFNIDALGSKDTASSSGYSSSQYLAYSQASWDIGSITKMVSQEGTYFARKGLLGNLHFFAGLSVFLDPKATQDIPATQVSSLPLRLSHGSSSDSGESHGNGYHRNSALRLRDSGLGGVTGIFLSMKMLRYCDLKMRSEISGCTDIILIRYAILELLRFV